MPPLTVLAIMAIFLILAFFVSRLERLAFLAPKSTKRIKGAAQSFCLDQCRNRTWEVPARKWARVVPHVAVHLRGSAN